MLLEFASSSSIRNACWAGQFRCSSRRRSVRRSSRAGPRPRRPHPWVMRAHSLVLARSTTRRLERQRAGKGQEAVQCAGQLGRISCERRNISRRRSPTHSRATLWLESRLGLASLARRERKPLEERVPRLALGGITFRLPDKLDKVKCYSEAAQHYEQPLAMSMIKCTIGQVSTQD